WWSSWGFIRATANSTIFLKSSSSPGSGYSMFSSGFIIRSFHQLTTGHAETNPTGRSFATNGFSLTLWPSGFCAAPQRVSSGLRGVTSTFLVELSQPFRERQTSEARLWVVAIVPLGDRTTDPTDPFLDALKSRVNSCP